MFMPSCLEYPEAMLNSIDNLQLKTFRYYYYNMKTVHIGTTTKKEKKLN